MKLDTYFNRIIKKRSFFVVLMIALVLSVLASVYNLFKIKWMLDYTDNVEFTRMNLPIFINFFNMTTKSVGTIHLSKISAWLLPMLVSLLVTDVTYDDFSRGYLKSMLMKTSFKSYLIQTISSSVVVSFVLAMTLQIVMTLPSAFLFPTLKGSMVGYFMHRSTILMFPEDLIDTMSAYWVMNPYKGALYTMIIVSLVIALVSAFSILLPFTPVGRSKIRNTLIPGVMFFIITTLAFGASLSEIMDELSGVTFMDVLWEIIVLIALLIISTVSVIKIKRDFI